MPFKSDRNLELTYGGGIRHAGIGYSSQHKKSDIVLLDNPQSLHSLERSNLDSLSEIRRLLKDPVKGLILVVTRRLSEDDLSHRFHTKMTGWGCLSLSIIALNDEEWILPPDVNYTRKKGELLHEYRESWEEIQGYLIDLGGKHFSHQYLQSQYVAQAAGSMEFTKEDGTRWAWVGNIDSTTVTMNHLNQLREEYLANQPKMA